MFNNIYTKFVTKILFPLHERLKKHQTVKIHKALEKSQWLSTHQLIKQQEVRLNKFILHASTHVSYYKKILRELNIQAKDIVKITDLQQLPFLSKAVIKDNFKALKADNTEIVKPFTTGGSSGTPLTFLLGNERISHDVAQKWRATRWWNVDIGDKEIVAWGSPIELGAQDRVRRIRDKLFRSQLMPAFDLTENNILSFISEIKSYQPKMLFGYPSVFSLIAKTARRHNIDMTQLDIKVIFVTAERLYPYQRQSIESTFNAPVANGYGSRDAGFIAHQCPEGGMHLSAEDIIVEIINTEGEVVPDGEKGEIVVTHLATLDFPFIRYRTGDIAVKSTKKCPCGRGLPLLQDIEGRTTDFVVAENGTLMHGLALIYILRELAGIDEFKITQESLELTRVEYVAQQPLPEQIVLEITSGFKARLGEGVTVKLEHVKQIAPEKSGKFRYVISKVEQS
jgi:phenylacetate-CoA ligase